eukprot:11490287-Ditylum_brightwellii.AAC.1
MVAVTVGPLCPAGACKGTRQLGSFWVAWGTVLALPAVSLVGHGWQLMKLTTLTTMMTHMTPKM